MSSQRTNTTDDFILKMHDITKSFPGVKALQNVNLEIKRGEIHAIVGENGAGKSTLLKILAGAYTRDQGTIEIDGERVEALTPKIAENLGIAIIYQEFSTLPHLSISENIFLGRQPRNWHGKGFIDWNKCNLESRDLLKRVGLDISPDIKASQLKVAEQQMLEIAKALSKKAKIIIMDEPTAPLTNREIENLFSVIRELKAQGVTIIYVSHRLIEITEICDRVTVIRDGCNIGTAEIKDISIQEMIRMMVGRNVTEMFPKARVDIGEKLLEVINLSTEDKLSEISFHVGKGEIVGISGLVGAGRTELARAIFGADPITSGIVKINGTPIQIKNPATAIRAKIGLVPEDRKHQGLVLMMNVTENTTLANLLTFMHFGKLSIQNEERVTKKFVDKLRIVTPNIYEETGNLSGGNQQKVVLSKWLCANCNLLIIDEPTRGIDVGAKVEIYELMNELVKSGIGIIMISSELPELIGICDRILVMHEGKLCKELHRNEFSEEAIMSYAATGKSIEENIKEQYNR